MECLNALRLGVLSEAGVSCIPPATSSVLPCSLFGLGTEPRSKSYIFSVTLWLRETNFLGANTATQTFTLITHSGASSTYPSTIFSSGYS